MSFFRLNSALAASAPVAGGANSGRCSPANRLVGVDLARGLAVFGMYAVHVGPSPSEGGVTGFFLELAHGRSSALFALLAGFSLVLITGRIPKTGQQGRQAATKIVIRALILLALGLLLEVTQAPVVEILAFYGLYFLLVLPLYRLDAVTLAAIGLSTTLVLPQLSFLLNEMMDEEMPFVTLWLSGAYPAITWTPFVIAGMAVARLNLTKVTTRRWLAIAGIVLAVLGYGGSALALHYMPGVAEAITEQGGDIGDLSWSNAGETWSGYGPVWLWVASPHSDTTFSILGNTGVALLVLAISLAVSDTRLRVLTAPIATVGSMSLTAYVLHIWGIWVFDPVGSLYELGGFVLATSAFAMLWRRAFGRGPLEALMGKAADLSRFVP
ncbi:heparan-alpha-glucosaminide N-acetyltransferase domain-containing protein [Mesorhizobium sp. WSM3626]|uniref:heparan-alpha-glucosaminide N-acetyltransferase domain-containing protein n=1 Tax=Mesorhizobium sp. WSM3626 TaxID=1040987 RepID=UPI0004805D50|nr:heparan-alpha-glucosaminide N-acetyltransferase domain-containing protein [Mesorhizobium sp. WSM3626]